MHVRSSSVGTAPLTICIFFSAYFFKKGSCISGSNRLLSAYCSNGSMPGSFVHRQKCCMTVIFSNAMSKIRGVDLSGLQSRFSTVCPQCSNVVHAARSVCNSCQFDMKEYRLKKKMDKQEKNVSRGQHKRQHNHVHGIWSKINEYVILFYALL